MDQSIQSDTAVLNGEAADSSSYSLYMCTVCGWIYDEAKGLPEAGIPPGTRWEDVPEDFNCPECSESKEAFEKIDV